MTTPQQQSTDAIEHVFRAWDDALGAFKRLAEEE